MSAPISREDEAWVEHAAWLLQQGYHWPLPMPDERYIALIARPFNVRLVLGEIDDRTSFLDGWCYSNEGEAAAGLLDWWQNPDRPEPTGWFRHPGTGRRIARGPGEYDQHGREIPIGQEYLRP